LKNRTPRIHGRKFGRTSQPCQLCLNRQRQSINPGVDTFGVPRRNEIVESVAAACVASP
jgi:hypothetical protein